MATIHRDIDLFQVTLAQQDLAAAFEDALLHGDAAWIASTAERFASSQRPVDAAHALWRALDALGPESGVAQFRERIAYQAFAAYKAVGDTRGQWRVAARMLLCEPPVENAWSMLHNTMAEVPESEHQSCSNGFAILEKHWETGAPTPWDAADWSVEPRM